MTSLPWYECIGIVLCTGAVTLILTPLALRFAIGRGIVDQPGPIKQQASPVPYLGGLAIVVSFSLVVGVASLIDPPRGSLGVLGLVLGVAVVLSVLGVVDDIVGLPPWLRLVFETGAAIGMWASGTRAQLLVHRLPMGNVFDALVTVIWIVGVTNAFNILDNMDGLSAGIAGIASLSLFIVAYLNGQYLVAVLALALVGCAAGFLRHNFHPAKIYMGDAGSLYLGFLLAVLCLRLRTYEVTRMSFVVPVLIVGVAIFDTTLVTVTRIAHRRSPFQGGLDHTSHRLVFIGVPVRTAVVCIYSAGVVLGWLAIAVSRIDRATTLILGGLVVAVGIAAMVLLAQVPVYDSSKRRHLMFQEVRSREEPLAAPGSGRVAVELEDVDELEVGSEGPQSSLSGR